MRTIWKFPLDLTDKQTLNMPQGAQALTVQMQRGQPCLWALVDQDAPREGLEVRIHGTGHPISDNLDGFTYMDTFQIQGGMLVFHAFTRISPHAGGGENA